MSTFITAPSRSSASRPSRSGCIRTATWRTHQQAREEIWPHFKSSRDRIGAERGWPPVTRASFDQEVEHGSMYVGAPETVARRIAAAAKALGIARFDMKYSQGTLAHEKLMRSITLYGEKVIPLVRDMVA